MHILYLSPYLPFPPYTGGKIRAFQLLKFLSKDHRLTLVSLTDDLYRQEHCRALAPLCSAVHTVPLSQGASPSKWKKRWKKLFRYGMGGSFIQERFLREELFRLLRREEEKTKWDAAVAETFWMAPYVRQLAVSKRLWHFPNLESLSLRREFEKASSFGARMTSYFEERYARKMEASIGRSGDRCLLASKEDEKRFLQSAPGAETVVIPNGADTKAVTPAEGPGEKETFLFVGSFQYPPNVDGVLYFHKEILPFVRKKLPASKWLAVGSHPPRSVSALHKPPAVEIAGFVEDLNPFYEKSAAAVVPLRIGSGSRVKILEAMAWGRPVISTSVGCEGLHVKDGENILIADSPNEFAGALVRVLQDQELARKLGRAGRRLVEEEYAWDKLWACAKDLLR